jgi:L-ascorbate metabolism protein UlaG (beta-lactamase superfamily)
MRLKLGRPDIARYRDRFDTPVAGSGAPVTLTWLGVSTLLVDDGATAVLTDGFFSRPGLIDVGLRRWAPSQTRIEESLTRAGIDRLAAVIPVHTHFDHALDSAVVAQRTGASMIGGTFPIAPCGRYSL